MNDRANDANWQDSLRYIFADLKISEYLITLDYFSSPNFFNTSNLYYVSVERFHKTLFPVTFNVLRQFWEFGGFLFCIKRYFPQIKKIIEHKPIYWTNGSSKVYILRTIRENLTRRKV